MKNFSCPWARPSVNKLNLIFAAFLTLAFLQGQAQHFSFAKQIVGIGNEVGRKILEDPFGNFYFTGIIEDTTDMDPGPAVYNLTTTAINAGFLCKWNSNGDFIRAFAIGDTLYNTSESIAIDKNGDVYVCGYISGTADLDPGPGTHLVTSFANSLDPYVCKFDSAGNFLWGKLFPGAGNDYAKDLSLDANGNVYFVGYYKDSIDLDPGPGVQMKYGNGPWNVFFLKMDSSGNLLWAKSMEGKSGEFPTEIQTDAASNFYIIGQYSDTVDVDPSAGVHNIFSNGGTDFMICKYDSNANLIWATGIGGPNTDLPEGIAIDAFQDVYIVGEFKDSVDFDPGTGSTVLKSMGDYDAFILKLDSAGNLIWVRQITGIENIHAKALSLDAYNDVYYTGSFRDTVDFDPGVGVDIHIDKGVYNAYVSKLDGQGSFQWASSFEGTSQLSGYSIDVTSNLDVYSLGGLMGTADFDPDTAVFNLTSYSSTVPWDIYVSKLSSCNAELDTSVINDGGILIANDSAVSYQWMYCDSILLPNDTNKSFTPTSSGNYAVIVSVNGCSDTSECWNVIITDRASVPDESLVLYPNPAGEEVRIAGLKGKVLQAVLIDQLGRKYPVEIQNESINLDGIADGVYLLSVGGKQSILIKQ